ncbi:hypothetical protein [Ramlibacter sp.]|uniref:hypothetical protein n=1 Tax=Ramlibacter sp. TaxID=1917967 RepID=UPI0025D11BBF|nr:hypothetical protein [Ramlibacter sp.]
MRRHLHRLAFLAFSGALFASLAASALAQSAPQDWSHRYVVYANPETSDEAAAKGAAALERWKLKFKDARFAQQVARKMRLQRPGADGLSPQHLAWYKRFDRHPPTATQDMHRDWSNVLGGASGVGRAGVYPAKFSFDIFATPSCANDFVVYTTTSDGATGSGTAASQTGSFSNNPAAGGTVTLTRTGSPAIVLTASAGSNLVRNFQIGANATATAVNLAAAITRNGGAAGIQATSAGAVVTVTALSPGTVTTVTLAAALGNFTWAGNNLAGGSGTTAQPTIVAFNQLYASCGTTPTTAVPTTFWSYNTGAGANTLTSPVLSFDGKQVAFVQSSSGNVANLVLLKWSSTASVGTVGAPTVPATQTLANYRNCTAPCMAVIPFSGSPDDTNSSPFYDYIGDTLYVGADNGTLHKFTGVFNGTPAEQTTGGFPATVSTGNMLSSPVYDSATGLVYVGSDTGVSTGGQLHSVCAATGINATLCSVSGAVVNSGQLATFTIQQDGNNTTGVRETPVLDSTAKRVYVFVESDPNSACGGVNCKAIYQLRTDISINGSVGTRANIGRGQIYNRVLYAGAFDNTYYTSANPASPSGFLYMCGALGDGSDSKKPTLWRIPIASNVMGAAVVGPTLVSTANFTDNANCSPVTMVMNGTNEYLYVSVSAIGNDTGCSGSCIYMYNMTGKTWNTSATANAGLSAPGGTGGIIVDNISSTAGASQIYYSTLTGPGNAVQASQAGLN